MMPSLTSFGVVLGSPAPRHATRIPVASHASLTGRRYRLTATSRVQQVEKMDRVDGTSGGAEACWRVHSGSLRQYSHDLACPQFRSQRRRTMANDDEEESGKIQRWHTILVRRGRVRRRADRHTRRGIIGGVTGGIIGRE